MRDDAGFELGDCCIIHNSARITVLVINFLLGLLVIDLALYGTRTTRFIAVNTPYLNLEGFCSRLMKSIERKIDYKKEKIS